MVEDTALVTSKSKNEPTAMEALEADENRLKKRHMSISASRHISNFFGYIVLIIISIVWILPFVFITAQSFRVEYTGQTTYLWPQEWGLSNYFWIFSADSDWTQWYFNTLIIALACCILQSLFQIAMAYVLSRFRFKSRKLLMNLMLILGMFPGFLSMIILYYVLKSLGLSAENAVPGLILVYVASSGMGYYVTKGYFDTISKSLDEAARIDGATRATIFVKVILPLAKPIVIYSLLTAFMSPWGDFIFARYLSANTNAGMNVAVGMWKWMQADQLSGNYVYFCTGGVLVSIPIIVLFLFLQRYYVEGVTGGAVKG